jgi:hypothetical protein
VRENFWVNSLTNTELSVHCPAGSPRAWLLRAVGSSNGELYIMNGSMHPKSIAVAGLWLKEGARLPDTGNNKTLYRFFDVPEKLNSKMHPKYNKKVPHIGMCVSVPADEILVWIRAFKQSGCKWLWWAMPEADPGPEEKPTRMNRYKRMDHNEIYAKLDQGMELAAIARDYDVPINTIRYVWQKWKDNQPAGKSCLALSEETIDAIRGDLAEGVLTQKEIANRYHTTRATVNKWARRFNLSPQEPKNGKTKAASSA